MKRYKVLISLLFLGFSLTIIAQSRVIPFNVVPATVTESSRITVNTSSNQPGRYHYIFTYEYNYLGQRYTSNRYTYLRQNRSVGVCNHAVGDVVTAYISRRDPEYAVINPKVSRFVYAIAGIGSLMLTHSILDYAVDSPSLASKRWLQIVHRRLGTGIGLTIIFGGLGYFCYTLFVAATQNCVN